MDKQMIARLDEVQTALAEAEEQLADPAVLGDQAKYTEIAKHHAELRPLVAAFAACREAEEEAQETAQLASEETDPGTKAELEALAAEWAADAERLEHQLRLMLVPRDPNDEKDVIVEVRAAAGGDEAAIWAGDLFRMYERYAERRTWAIEPIASSISEVGGFKEVTFAVKGKGAYSRLKFEAGPHRVQRVPKTESQGRVHTSIATVAVLPEAEEVEVEINDHDIDVDVFRVKVGWNEGTQDRAVPPVGTEVTYSHREYNGTTWDSAGCDGSNDRETTAEDTVAISSENTWYSWDVTSSVNTPDKANSLHLQVANDAQPDRKTSVDLAYAVVKWY